MSELRQELQEKTTRVPSYIEDSASLCLKQDANSKAALENRSGEERKSEWGDRERAGTAQKGESPPRAEVKGGCSFVGEKEFVQQRDQAQPNQIPLNPNKEYGNSMEQVIEGIQEQGNEKRMEEGNISGESKSSDASRNLHMNQYNNLLKGKHSTRVA